MSTLGTMVHASTPQPEVAKEKANPNVARQGIDSRKSCRGAGLAEASVASPPWEQGTGTGKSKLLTGKLVHQIRESEARIRE
jgi:hypothetical protein